MGGYLPGKDVPKNKMDRFINFLETTDLHPDYIRMIKETERMPGKSESNEEGWMNQPWYEEWFNRLPEKKKEDPFKGTEFRCRVPMDPVSEKKSMHPHPMLSSDAETIAGSMAIVNSGINKEDIDLVLCATLVPDRHVPLNASLVQHKIGLNAAAYNIDTCCASFVTMMEIAMTYVRAGLYKNVLIVGSAIDSHITDKSNYYSVNTGDAAVAGIVSEVSPEYGYLASHATSHGSRHAAIVFHKRKPEILMKTAQRTSFEGEYVTFYDQNACKEIAKEALVDMNEVAQGALQKCNLTSKDIDFLAVHQPATWAAKAWRDAIGVPPAKAYESFKKYGNIACCAAATNMLEAIEKGLVKVNDKLMIASSGVGENHIALLHTIPPQLIENVRV